MNADASPIKLSGWALILGASSGFGAATSLALARAGCHIFGVHLDRKSTLPNAQRVVAEIQALGREVRFFNTNAADEEKRTEVAVEMERTLRERNEMGQLRIMLHSLAFGTLRLFVAEPMKEAVSKITRTAPKVRGIDRRSVRTSLSPSAFSFALDPTKCAPDSAVAELQKRLQIPGATLVLLQVMSSGTTPAGK